MVPDHPAVPMPSITLRPRYGIRATLHARSSGQPRLQSAAASAQPAVAD
jgi:hypothetical protein